ncbi:MAG: uncharacterized protein KVP18_003681 [Porospora cf. gigantea A]|uniref:uncharacterized protein n=2 Tax=Porospora cf. gigantea A TaxID=2853593 RepID=UPI003559A09C|nr:MAG: hypothetical protein KVP18_003681 [Porospora cf. gigantea A]
MRQRRQGDDDITSSHTEPESPVVVSDNELPNLATDATDEAREKVRMNFSVRVVYTFYWLFGYFGIVWAGHFYLAIMVHVLAVLMFREILSLKRSVEKDKTLPLYFSLRWYFYVLTVCGANHRYLLALLSALERLWSGAAVFRPCVEWIEIHFSMVIFILYLLGFVAFILTLRRFSLRYQMQQFGILILTLLFVVCPTATFVGLIYTGIYWFFVASGCVITNDIFAYLFGINFGRTRLLLISPKKTVEGFIGASLVTPIFALGVGSLLTMFPHFVCPANEIELVPFQFQSTCELHPVFQWQQFHLGLSYLRPSWVNDMPFHSAEFSFWAMPIHFHLVVLSLFASIFAPFGGFFASAFKRAIHAKDFGDSIPGHGGIADRFDCQLIMTIFTYIYVKTFIFRSTSGVTSVDALLSAIRRLSSSDQALLLTELTKTVVSSTV